MNLTPQEKEALLLLAIAEDEDEGARGRSVWVHDINRTRNLLGEYHTLMPELRKDERRFYIYFRMTIACFDELLNLIKEDIQKEHTHFREPISAEERLVVTLRFLATGDSYKTTGHSFRMKFETVSVIVNEVCGAIIKKLQPLFMPEPTSETWEKSALGYSNRWQFPNCIGSIDGKHVTVTFPSNSGSTFCCYKNKFSIVLLSIVDPDYKFLCVDVGGYGKNTDGGIFAESAMGQRIKNKTFTIPGPKPLPGQNLPTPHCLVGDEAFSLSPSLMKPFPQRKANKCRRLRKYNYRLCRARGVVENAFGILVQKWRLYNRPLEVSVKSAINIVLTTCILHNFLRERHSDIKYFECLDSQPSNTRGIIRPPRNPTRYAMVVRERFTGYFCNNDIPLK